jgi:hypothetical protein
MFVMRSSHDMHEMKAYRAIVSIFSSVRMFHLENRMTDFDEILYGHKLSSFFFISAVSNTNIMDARTS